MQLEVCHIFEDVSVLQLYDWYIANKLQDFPVDTHEHGFFIVAELNGLLSNIFMFMADFIDANYNGYRYSDIILSCPPDIEVDLLMLYLDVLNQVAGGYNNVVGRSKLQLVDPYGTIVVTMENI